MNWNMIGHEWAVELLSDHIAANRLRHAYLFTGPSGVGRKTLSLRFAQAVNCQHPPNPGEFCGKCRSCNLIQKMLHPDLAIIQAEEAGGVLKVDAIRELQHSLSLTPYEAAYRIAILLRFEEANLSAANALLKTLEEPAPRVILILTAENAENLLPTIASRCEILRLRPVMNSLIRNWLLDSGEVSQEEAELISTVASGRPGFAYRLSTDPVLMDQRSEWLGDLQDLIVSDHAVRFDYAENKAKDKDTLRIQLPIWLSYWRDILIVSTGSQSPISNPDWKEKIAETAERVGTKKTQKFISAIMRTISFLDNNVNPRLAMEVLLLDLANTVQ